MVVRRRIGMHPHEVEFVLIVVVLVLGALWLLKGILR